MDSRYHREIGFRREGVWRFPRRGAEAQRRREFDSETGYETGLKVLQIFLLSNGIRLKIDRFFLLRKKAITEGCSLQ
jgi:hypothetical protein